MRRSNVRPKERKRKATKGKEVKYPNSQKSVMNSELETQTITHN